LEDVRRRRFALLERASLLPPRPMATRIMMRVIIGIVARAMVQYRRSWARVS